MTLEKENSGIDHCLLVARFQLTRSNTDAIREGLKTYIQSLVERKGKNLTAIEKNKCYARTQEEDLVDWFDEAERIRRYTMFGSWEDRAPRDRYTPMGLADIEAMIARIESELDVLTRTAP
jgi:predicted RNA-binding Zn ribbon-like protein